MRISFETCNSAFGETDDEHRAEVINTVLDVVKAIRKGKTEGKVIDANGNTVGSWSLDRGCGCKIGEGK